MATVERYGWACLTEGCFEHGEGPGSDKQAEKHGKAFKHGTRSWLYIDTEERDEGKEADRSVERP